MATVNHEQKTGTDSTSLIGALAAWLGPGDPHPYRGPFTRWPHAADGALALFVFAGSLVAIATSRLDDGEDLTLAAIRDRPVGAFVLLAVAATALWWRRSRPVTVTAFVLFLMIVWAIAGYGDGQDLAIIVATYSVGRFATNYGHSLLAVFAAAAVGIIGTVIDANQRIDVVPAIVLTGLPWYIGRRVRDRGDYLALLKERAAHLEAGQQARARQAIAEERARIARELHDVVAHQVSMMTVQAGAAKTIARSDLEAAIEAMGDVEGAGREALGELRHLLGVLRPDAADSDHLGPQPGLADLESLVDHLSHTGAGVTLTVGDVPAVLPTAVDLSAYRIVQESLTNIIKHAGPNPTVDISIALDDRRLVIDISNTTSGRTTAPELPGSAYGITGMRERATLLGGSLTAGSQPPDRYRVHASIPVDPEPR